MTLPEPFTFEINPRLPLLILSCSATKRDLQGMVRFADLYDGPLWRDLRRSGFPLSNVAALSGLHGYLAPGRPIETYNCQMTEERARRFICTGADLSRIARDAKAANGVLVVGGELYRLVVAAADRAFDIRSVDYAAGSFLQLRKRLNAWLRQQNDAGRA